MVRNRLNINIYIKTFIFVKICKKNCKEIKEIVHLIKEIYIINNLYFYLEMKNEKKLFYFIFVILY